VESSFFIQKGEAMFVLKNFRSYQLAVSYYHECEKIKLPSHLKDQLLRASSSVVLNLSEGSAKPSVKERIRYYTIAFASLRETQSILELIRMSQKNPSLVKQADTLAACLYRLVNQPLKP
jgi:four helix bundle protein